MTYKLLTIRLSQNEIKKLDYLLAKLWEMGELNSYSRTEVIRYLINSWWKVKDALEERAKEKLEKIKNEKEKV